MGLPLNEKAQAGNNYQNSKFYINPIGLPNNKEKSQAVNKKRDIRTLLMKHGYLKSISDVKSPVKEYIQHKNDPFAAIKGIFGSD